MKIFTDVKKYVCSDIEGIRLPFYNQFFLKVIGQDGPFLDERLKSKNKP